MFFATNQLSRLCFTKHGAIANDKLPMYMKHTQAVKDGEGGGVWMLASPGTDNHQPQGSEALVPLGMQNLGNLLTLELLLFIFWWIEKGLWFNLQLRHHPKDATFVQMGGAPLALLGLSVGESDGVHSHQVLHSP